MKNNILTLFTLFLTVQLLAQNPTVKEIDSMIIAVDHFTNLSDPDLEQAIGLAKKTYALSKKINYQSGIGKSTYLITSIAYNLGDDKTVISYSSIGKDLEDRKDYYELAETLRVRGMSLNNLSFNKEARKEFRTALEIADKIEHPDKRKFLRGNIFTAFSLSFETESETDKKAIDSILFYAKKAYLELESGNPKFENMQNYLSLSSVNLGAYCLYFKRDLDSVEYYLNKALQLSRKNKYAFVACLSNQNLGKMFFLRKQYQKSIPFYEEALSLLKTVNNPYIERDLYQDISKSYAALKEDTKANEYLTLYVRLNDSIITAEKKAMKLPMEQILAEKEAKMTSSRSWYTSIIAISILLLICFAFLSYLFFKKFRKEKMSKAEKEMLLIEKKLEIEKINDAGDERLSEIIQMAINDNPLFYIRFQEFYEPFCNTLKHLSPTLTLGELKCCALLKLNFSTKEIARFTNSTIRAIEQRKYRIRKKLNIPSDVDINIWMMNL